MAVLAGRCRLGPLGHGFLDRNIEIPLVFIPLILQPVLRQTVGFPVVVVRPAVTLGADFRLPGFGHVEVMSRMARIALILIDMAARAAIRNLALRHTRIDFHFHVGLVVQRVRRTALRPLILRPGDRIALGFALRKFLQVAGATGVGGRQLDVLAVVRLLRGVDVEVAIDTAHFFQLLALAQLAQRAQILFDRLQLRLLIEGVVLRGQLPDLVQIRMRALLPRRHPARGFVGVALHALLAAGHFFHRLRRLIEGVRVKIPAEGDRLPIVSILALAHTLRGVQVPLEERFVQLLGRGRSLDLERLIGFLRHGGEIRLGLTCSQHAADHQRILHQMFYHHSSTPSV